MKIHKTNKADTRFCKENPSKEDLYKDSLTHIKDVKKILKMLSNKLESSPHDYTKLKYIDDFYEDFMKTLNEGADFKSGKWYNLHIHEERHHPEDNVVDDINLLDILEYIADNVAAGKARSGKIRKLNLSTDVLLKAFNNTVSLIDKLTE